MSKTFNIYCDESSHIEHDHNDYMLVGYVSSAYNQVKGHVERIADIKKKHSFYGEIKWGNISSSQHQFYRDLVDYFFATDLLFRAVVINKAQINAVAHGMDYDTFYYKMYYQLLNHNINSMYAYNVYLDIKDTLSANKVNKLKEVLNTKFGVYRAVQNMHSHETPLMQLADVMLGALAYNLNNPAKKVTAKVDIIERIKSHSKQPLNCSTYPSETKMNLFFIELK